MSTLREQITSRMVVALTGATGAGANVFRSRENSITRAMSPAIVCMPEGEQSQRMGQFVDKHEYAVNVAIFVRGDPWDQVADAIAADAHRVLLADAQLAAMVCDLRKVGTDYEAEEADRTAGTLSAHYRVTYLSQAADIALAP